MTEIDEVWVANRTALIGIAYHVLGEWAVSEDIALRVWERAADEKRSGRVIAHPRAWMRTVATRLAIDEARSARARRETYVGTWLPEPIPTADLPADIVVNRSMLSLGLLRVLQELDPVDRAVFVLREAFAVPYREIGECVGRTPVACRQVVSRARRLLPAVTDSLADADRRLLAALVAAVADGDAESVVRLISEGSVLWSDGGGIIRASPKPIVGAAKVTRFLFGVQRINPIVDTRYIDVNGSVGAVVEAADGHRLVVVERDAQGVCGFQMHAHPIKIARALARA